MDFLEYVAAAVYVLVVIRTFSFGIYGLKAGRSGTFALVLVMLAVSGALFWQYLRLNT